MKGGRKQTRGGREGGREEVMCGCVCAYVCVTLRFAPESMYVPSVYTLLIDSPVAPCVGDGMQGKGRTGMEANVLLQHSPG